MLKHRRLQDFSEKHSGVSQKKGKLGFHFERICNANSDLLSVLKTNKAVYHHNCFSKYSDSKLKASSSHLKSRNVQKMKREESRHICQLNREKDFIYSIVDVVKRTLMLISSLQGHIRQQY